MDALFYEVGKFIVGMILFFSAIGLMLMVSGVIRAAARDARKAREARDRFRRGC